LQIAGALRTTETAHHIKRAKKTGCSPSSIIA
jgi:hypothetical protein